MDKFPHVNFDLEKNMIANIPLKYAKKQLSQERETRLINSLSSSLLLPPPTVFPSSSVLPSLLPPSSFSSLYTSSSLISLNSLIPLSSYPPPSSLLPPPPPPPPSSFVSPISKANWKFGLKCKTVLKPKEIKKKKDPEAEIKKPSNISYIGISSEDHFRKEEGGGRRREEGGGKRREEGGRKKEEEGFWMICLR